MLKRESNAPVTAKPTFAEAVRVWARIGLLSFGGPAGQIALMHKELVEDRKWIDEQRYLHALNFCMLLPGPEAMQLATYVGWRLHGLRGGLTAGLLFVLPGALMMLALSMLYVTFGKLKWAEGLLLGVKAAVLAVVIEALLRIGRRALKTHLDWWLAGLAFIAIFLLAVPFPVIVLAAALFGFWYGSGTQGPLDGPVAESPPIAQTLATVCIWLAIWFVPLSFVAWLFGHDHVLATIGWFFSKLAVVSFGGAYAVLAYMREAVPSTYGWLDKVEMVDALGLAETTPGPLILVTQFVGFLAGFRKGGGFDPYWMGTLGAAVTTWATFAPCFLWILAGAPYVERLHAEPRLRSALAAVTAAVVGVILNLTVTFGIDVLSPASQERWLGPIRLYLPDLTSLSLFATALTILAMVLMFRLHQGIFVTLAVCGTLGLAGAFVG